MKIIEVNDGRTGRQFLDIVNFIYKDYPAYIRPLDADILKAIGAPEVKKIGAHEIKKWIVLNDDKTVLGRIAAFFKPDQPANRGPKVGRVGFFEAVNNPNVSKLLFDTAMEWLRQNGIQAVDGPVNAGERDKFWGLLVQGPGAPGYLENFNPPYYRQLFEAYGFQEYIHQDTYALYMSTFRYERLEKVYNWMMRKPNYEVRHLQKAHLRRYASDFVEVYNAAWRRFENFKPITVDDAIREFKGMAPVIDEKYILFFYVDQEPAGFILALPDINKYFKPFKGKFGLINKLRFLLAIRFTRNDTLRGMVFGVHPKHQGKGIDAALIFKEWAAMREGGQYETFLINWIGGFNNKMQSLMKDVNAEVHKVHVTYRYMLDRSIPFEPYKIETEQESRAEGQS